MQNFECMTLFTTALCNLNCSYCYICKDINGGLSIIDKDIEEDFKNNQQIKQILEYDPTISNTLKTISLWGGEPFLYVERFIDHIEDYFKAFPHINCIDVSTNLTLPDHYEKIQNLINTVDKYYHLLQIDPNRKFQFDIQISIDGYKEMNDFSRGQGVTDKIYFNWKKIINNLYFDENKFNVRFFTKPTFSKSTWHFMDTKEKAYKWFESYHNNLWIPYIESNSKADFHQSLWNNAQPSEYCQEDGIEYAKLTKIIQEIQEDIKRDFKSYRCFDSLIPEANLTIGTCREDFNNNFDRMYHCMAEKKCGGSCGVFCGNIVPIPHNKFTMCHRGLFDEYTDYVQNLNKIESLNGLAGLWSQEDVSYWLMDDKQLHRMQKMMSQLNEHPSQIFYTDLVQQVKMYADSGIIDSKYQNINNIIPTIGYWFFNSCCIQDAFIFGGTWTTRSPLEIPLMYNGTMDIVLEEIERIQKERKIL